MAIYRHDLKQLKKTNILAHLLTLLGWQSKHTLHYFKPFEGMDAEESLHGCTCSVFEIVQGVLTQHYID